ncbi:DUF6900 domain-containing protein [Paraburkholderia sp. DHOC27]|uniref:DUF6900 domain-containing protein n=1 Tax=Paraburkholderia sp. DHOC27 TaxID=2303330 RepID=UPI000E3CDFD3|nr:hypothetical protein [Paraburkholderia sp. DHOC27]RFU45930.1 hypothetical protein D0B32_19900 [Paraburkholderia sp. DHOC27]
MSNIVHDERVVLLRGIANEILGIERLEPTGKPTADFRIVNIEQVALALEAAYDAGLVVGRRVARGETDDPQTYDEVFFP